MDTSSINWRTLGIFLTAFVLGLRRVYGLRFAPDRAKEFAQEAFAEILSMKDDQLRELLSNEDRLRNELRRAAINIVRRHARSDDARALRFFADPLGGFHNQTDQLSGRDLYEVMPQAEPAERLLGDGDTVAERLLDLQRKLQESGKKELLEVYDAVALHNKETPADIAAHLGISIKETYRRLRNIRDIANPKSKLRTMRNKVS